MTAVCDQPERSGSSMADDAACQTTIRRVLHNVVMLDCTNLCSFGENPAGRGQATGFVVDANLGYVRLLYIMTCAHVIGGGPSRICCVFGSSESVELSIVFSDPIHDFAILHYDPDTIKFAKVDGLQLRPDLARSFDPRRPLLVISLTTG
ncbi:trypsin-like peptidase domain-containing protein [Purpureocillium lilacinum]|uniref:Trypsin-like peptidase domain-containing protein n=1 Tax=Purpureocillium lilacinum TaxID=33203 RepID=A0A179EXE4_PURLI|nr:trypsin-like peptidase domain-containing protein [Purpureocillium lilacinum]OAQ57856.1 trypsin-like peptidase domain-containing protein [Purpureocillium lilacinum]